VRAWSHKGRVGGLSFALRPGSFDSLRPRVHMQSGMVWSVWLVNQGLADILLPIQLVRCSSRFVNTCNSAQPLQCTICTIVLLTALKYFKHIWNFWYTVGVTWASEVVRFQCHDSLYLNWCRAKPNVQSHKLVICTVPQCCTMLQIACGLGVTRSWFFLE
jgi:hypothetical protein